MKHIKTLSELHQMNGYPPPENPLISLVKCDGSCCTNQGAEYTSDFYMIGFKKMKSGVMMYGKTTYDHDLGSMSFVKPRQILSIRNLELEEDGFLLYFHEDFLNGHPLHAEIRKYSYFDYEVNEALHLSPREEQIIRELYAKIEMEYYNNPDEFSKDIMLAHIDSILKYSQRFYKRQFINRTPLSGKTVSKFNEIISEHFQISGIREKGLPTVQFIAEKLHISSRYLSDMLKLETGKTAIELIHIYLISEAKNLLTGEDQTVAQIAYSLGFENPPYFSRLFKKETGISPNEFKKLHLN